MASASATLIRPTAAPARLRERPARADAEVTVTQVGLQVTGRLPEELDGCYVRIGPNPLRPADPGTQHAFTGDGMVHGLRLRDGAAQWYRNRWIRTDRVSRGLGERPVPGPRHGLSDNANANVIQHHGRVLALGEAGVLPLELDAELGTVASSDFDGTLPNGFTAHPECDPVTGELFAAAYYHELPYVQYLVVDPAGRVRKTERIEVSRPAPMMHALSLTDRHAVLYDLPVAFSPLLAGAGSRCPYAWERGGAARIGVLPREGRGSDVRWFEIEPCYVFHPLGAYELGDRIVVDAIRHERVFDRDLPRPAESAPTLWRWTVDLVRGTVTEQQLDDRAQEYPRIDERRKTMPYRYGYTVEARGGGGTACGSALFRHDLVRGSVREHRFAPWQEAGEALFVPRSPRSAEDDGWLLSLVHDASADRTDLVVLNADDFGGEPQAVVRLPVAVPRGFHGAWLSAQC